MIVGKQETNYELNNSSIQIVVFDCWLKRTPEIYDQCLNNSFGDIC